MKSTLLIVSLAFLMIGSLEANVVTCSNNAINAGQYTAIQTAVDAANPGDTVYVMGSPSAYGDVTIKKHVTMIGAGYAVTNTQNNWASIIGYVYLDSIGFGAQVSGTKIMGFNITGNIGQTGTGSLNYITLERNYINNYITVFGSNWTIRNNDIYALNIQNNSYCFVYNNFIGTLQNSNKTTVNISNNNFVTNNYNAFSTISNAIIANNIFYYCSPLASVTSCVFSNNVTTNSTAQVLPPAGNTGSGNLNNTPPGFVDASIPASTVGQSVIWNYNWHIATGSPAHNGGTDGTDIGVYGGTYPYPNMTGATHIPQMQVLNVSGTVPQGGNLNVSFKARKQN
jgi:hypothetical protein